MIEFRRREQFMLTRCLFLLVLLLLLCGTALEPVLAANNVGDLMKTSLRDVSLFERRADANGNVVIFFANRVYVDEGFVQNLVCRSVCCLRSCKDSRRRT